MIRTSTTIAAVAALAFAAAGCSKQANTAAAPGVTATAPASAEAASADTNMTGASSVEAKASDATSVVQDAAAAVVGPVSAATVGSLSASAFVDNAAQSDMYEQQAAEIALQRSHSPRIKQFAREMIAAHSKTTATLRAIVAKGDAGDAKLPSGLDQRRQGMIDNLKSASEDDFDARYVDQQQAAHKEAEILMGGYAKAGQNARLKTFAANTSPKVTAHYEMVKALDKANADHDAKPGDGGKSMADQRHDQRMEARHDAR